MFKFSETPLSPDELKAQTTADRIIHIPGRRATPPAPPAPHASSDAPHEPPATLPVALERIHKRLAKPEELRKLHLKHHHMSGEQFKFRTRALHLPKETYDLCDKIRAECEPCQKAAIAPSRNRTSGPRAEQFGELTFIDHCFFFGSSEHINVLVILDGATTLLTTEVVERTTEECNISLLRNYFDQYHLQPKCVVGDQAFMTPSWELFYNSLDIRLISLGPNTPCRDSCPSHQETSLTDAEFHQHRHSTSILEGSSI